MEIDPKVFLEKTNYFFESIFPKGIASKQQVGLTEGEVEQGIGLEDIIEENNRLNWRFEADFPDYSTYFVGDREIGTRVAIEFLQHEDEVQEVIFRQYSIDAETRESEAYVNRSVSVVISDGNVTEIDIDKEVIDPLLHINQVIRQLGNVYDASNLSIRVNVDGVPFDSN